MEPRYETQRRWTETASSLLGLPQDEGTAESVRAALGLDGLDHQQARRDFAAATTLTDRGTSIGFLLDRLVVDEALWGRVLHAGVLAKVWGQPFLWDPRLSRRVFSGGSAAGSLRARRPP